MLESVVTKTRDRKAAWKFLKSSMKRHGRSKDIVTDRLRTYCAALKDVNGRVKVSQRAAQNVATLGLARSPGERALASGRPRFS